MNEWSVVNEDVAGTLGAGGGVIGRRRGVDLSRQLQANPQARSCRSRRRAGRSPSGEPCIAAGMPNHVAGIDCPTLQINREPISRIG